LTGKAPLHSFNKNERLLRRKDYLLVKSEGRKITGNHFIVIRLQSSNTSGRIGVTASRKVGGAVVRNHVKRLVRECYRLNKAWFHSADYSVIARKSAAHLNFDGACNDLWRTLQHFRADHG